MVGAAGNGIPRLRFVHPLVVEVHLSGKPRVDVVGEVLVYLQGLELNLEGQLTLTLVLLRALCEISLLNLAS